METASRGRSPEKNRKPFSSKTPVRPPRKIFRRDAITDQVFDDIEQELPDLPGRPHSFEWPVTRKQALELLNNFLMGLHGRYVLHAWLEAAAGRR